MTFLVLLLAACAPSGEFARFQNTDLPGMNLKSFNTKNGVVEDCERACAHNSKCQGYTFGIQGKDEKRGKCWLKGYGFELKRNKAYVSGIRFKR